MFNKKVLKNNLVRMNTKQLVKFLREAFPSEGQKYSDLRTKIQVIKSLNNDDLIAAIARMERISHVNDIRQSIVIMSLVLSAVTLLFKAVYGDGLGTAILVIASVLYIYIAATLDRQKHFIAHYFKELLIQVKADKDSQG